MMRLLSLLTTSQVNLKTEVMVKYADAIPAGILTGQVFPKSVDGVSLKSIHHSETRLIIAQGGHLWTKHNNKSRRDWMSTARHHKPNELEMALKIAMKAIEQLKEQKPKGGLIVNKGQDIEAKMSYTEAMLCMERIQRRFAIQGAFSLGICGECTKWDTAYHGTAQYQDFGKCRETGKSMHRYDSCDSHSKTNGGWGL